MDGRLLLVPAGGLANRMRAVASACAACAAAGSRLTVLWGRDWALGAPFKSIFEPVDPALLAVRDASLLDLLALDRPRQHNLFVPLLPQTVLYGRGKVVPGRPDTRMARRIYEQDVKGLVTEGFDFNGWLRGRNCYMTCCLEFGSFTNDLYARLFRPIKPVMDTVGARREAFSTHTIGMHIRRTDCTEAVAKSPTSLFIEAGKREIEEHHDTRIFLATDDMTVKTELRSVFGDRLITSPPGEGVSRGDVKGIRDGLADLWTLAATNHIYGSAGSSFSQMAARIGRAGLTVLTRPE